MSNILKTTLATTFAAALALASGGSGGGGDGGGGDGTTATELRFGNEMIPAGGTVQAKLALTNPRPIMGGGGSFNRSLGLMDEVFGISIFSPAGDAYGVAQLVNGSVAITVASPLASLGTNLDYPFLTIAGHVNDTAALGATMPLDLSNVTLVDPTGASISSSAKPGLLTVGGSISVNNIVPGGGAWPAGTIVRVLGTGFSRSTSLNRTSFKISSWNVVSDSEIALVLGSQVKMDNQFVILSNPDKSTVTYFSYIRGVESAKSSVPVVASLMPMFPSLVYSQVQLQQNSRGINNNLSTALSIQNPNPAAVTVRLEAETPAMGKIAETTMTLNFGEKITRDLGEFFGLQLDPGTTVKASSSLPVQFLGFVADPATGATTPFAPAPL
jgi:hypothetical protein